MQRDDEYLAGGVETERDGPAAEPDDEGPRLGPILGEVALGPEVEAAIGQVSEEGGVLVDDPDDPESLARREPVDGLAAGLGERAVGPRDRVAVGVDGGESEVGVDPVDEAFGDGVLHVLGLLVDLVPGHRERMDQEEFDEAMPPEDLEREPLAGGGEAGPFIRGVGREVGLGECLEHPRDGPRRDVEPLRERAGRYGLVGGPARGDQVDRLDVILDGQARHDSSPAGSVCPVSRRRRGRHRGGSARRSRWSRRPVRSPGARPP